MNTNVVTAKQTDAPFGIVPVPPRRDFGIPRQFEHCAHIPAAGRQRLAGKASWCAWSAANIRHRIDFI